MKKIGLILSTLFYVLFAFAQPPEVQNGAFKTNTNNAELPLLLADSIQLFDKNGDIESLKPSAENDQIFFKEVESYKKLKQQTKSNPNSRSASSKEEAMLKRSMQRIESIATEGETQIEADVLYYDQGNFDTARAPRLLHALSLNPNHVQGLILWAANSIATGDTAQIKACFVSLDNLNQFSDEIQCYSKDLVASVPPGFVLITHGTWDTYGSLNEQFNTHRRDVTTISLDLLQSESYRNLLMKQGFKFPSQVNINVSYFIEFLKLNVNKHFALSMTIPSEYAEPIERDLVPNGLVFLYPSTMTDEEVLKNNELYLNSFQYMECGQEHTNEYEFLRENYFPMILTIEALDTDKSSDKMSTIEAKKIKLRRKN